MLALTITAHPHRAASAAQRARGPDPGRGRDDGERFVKVLRTEPSVTVVGTAPGAEAMLDGITVRENDPE